MTNLFGTNKRLELAFGRKPQQFVADIVRLIETGMPPTMQTLWQNRQLFKDGLKIGLKEQKQGPILEQCQTAPKLSELPMLTSWHSDGGPFVTLPLVYTVITSYSIHYTKLYDQKQSAESFRSLQSSAAG